MVAAAVYILLTPHREIALIRDGAVEEEHRIETETHEFIEFTETLILALSVAGFLLGPREQYVPATLAQLSRYPGLVVLHGAGAYEVNQRPASRGRSRQACLRGTSGCTAARRTENCPAAR